MAGVLFLFFYLFLFFFSLSFFFFFPFLAFYISFHIRDQGFNQSHSTLAIGQIWLPGGRCQYTGGPVGHFTVHQIHMGWIPQAQGSNPGPWVGLSYPPNWPWYYHPLAHCPRLPRQHLAHSTTEWEFCATFFDGNDYNGPRNQFYLRIKPCYVLIRPCS